MVSLKNETYNEQGNTCYQCWTADTAPLGADTTPPGADTAPPGADTTPHGTDTTSSFLISTGNL